MKSSTFMKLNSTLKLLTLAFAICAVTQPAAALQAKNFAVKSQQTMTINGKETTVLDLDCTVAEEDHTRIANEATDCQSCDKDSSQRAFQQMFLGQPTILLRAPTGFSVFADGDMTSAVYVGNGTKQVMMMVSAGRSTSTFDFVAQNGGMNGGMIRVSVTYGKDSLCQLDLQDLKEIITNQGQPLPSGF